MGKFKRLSKISGISTALLFSGLLLAMSLPFSGLKSLSVQTGSMKPAINPGDLVLVKDIPAHELQVGNVITYISPANKDQTITHRIVQKLGNENGPRTFITKGDANPAPDSPVSQRDVVGRVERRVPFAGKLVDFIRKPLGLILIIYVPALFIIVNELRRLASYYREQRPYLAEGFRSKLNQKSRVLSGIKALVFFLAVSMAIAIPVRAALQSTATLTGNSISSIPAGTGSPPVAQCNNNVTITSNTTQTATTGDASVNGDTTGGSATSGDAANSSTTSTTVTTSC